MPPCRGHLTKSFGEWFLVNERPNSERELPILGISIQHLVPRVNGMAHRTDVLPLFPKRSRTPATFSDGARVKTGSDPYHLSSDPELDFWSSEPIPSHCLHFESFDVADMTLDS